ncbi:MAG: 2-oxo acid dehydrogenase subunit E2 [Proteobacteria bacterium]|nr:2-oxo acid dehydrogenase subunit E2 [Pseudomonadota bacterium]
MSNLVDITAPESDDESSEGLVGSWLKRAGEFVDENQPLLEIVTDKVTLEVAAPASGVLIEVLKQTDDKVVPGVVLGRIDTARTRADAGGPASAAPQAAGLSPTSARTEAASDLSRRLSPAVRRLIKRHNLDVASLRGSGRGGRITVGDVEAQLAQVSAPRRQEAPGGSEEPALRYVPGAAGVAATPPRGLQSESVISPGLGEIPGDAGPPASPPGGRQPDNTRPPQSRREPHSPMRRQLAAHMVQSALRTAPHVTTIFEADLSAVLRHREAHKADFAARGAKLTLTAYFVAASVQALKAVPEVNSRWHDDGLELFADCNIGIGTAVKDLLVVPVIGRAQDLNLLGIAQALRDLTERARQGKLRQADVQHGTFTITNHGVSGSLIATPIIHQPQSAILGVGKLQKRLVVLEEAGEDRIAVRPLVYVTLTLDHRALNGYTANRFLQLLVEALERWPSYRE